MRDCGRAMNHREGPRRRPFGYALRGRGVRGTRWRSSRRSTRSSTRSTTGRRRSRHWRAQRRSTAIAIAAHAPLAGVPVAVKDNLCTRGVRPLPRRRMLEHYVPPYGRDRRRPAREAGASSSARLTATSSRWARRTENSAFGPCATRGARSHSGRHPARIGGGGGGKAGADGARSDTGRLHSAAAALCGGSASSRPTAVSRATVSSRNASSSTRSVLSRTVHDAALTLGVSPARIRPTPRARPEPVPDYTAAPHRRTSRARIVPTSDPERRRVRSRQSMRRPRRRP